MDKNNYIRNFDFNAIFYNLQSINEDEKVFLKALTHSIQERQGDFFDYLEERVLKEYHCQKRINTIHTFMQRNQDDFVNHFSPVLDSDEMPKNLVFVDCALSEIPYYEETKQKIIVDGKEKEVSLVHTDIFLEKEKIIFDLFQNYNIHAPRIYNPYARRAFLIHDPNDNQYDDPHIDLKRNEVEFQDKKIFQGNLFWNLNITPDSKLARYKEVPVSGEQFIRIRFENIKENSFIVIDGFNPENCLIKRSGQSIDIKLEDFELSDLQYQMVEIKEVHSNQELFSNMVKTDSIIPYRIRTKADIRLAVNAYYPYPDEFIGFFPKTNNNTFKGYSGNYKYPYSGFLDVGRANKNFCYLKFEKKHDDIFFEDRVEYLISFMRYQYPECYWVGEK